MNPFTVVIPSKTESNIIPCVTAILQHEESPRIVVVDDGIEWSSPENKQFILGNCHVIEGRKPFIFSVNCNLGASVLPEQDVILLNDDGLLETPKGFTQLSLISSANPTFGVISAACNNVGNTRQWPQPLGKDCQPRLEPRMVCFISVYIPRTTIKTVGLLDECFTAYGHEDDSYCYRVRKVGLKIGIFDGCFVDHTKLKSTFRDGHHNTDLVPGREIFIKLHGSFPL